MDLQTLINIGFTCLSGLVWIIYKGLIKRLEVQENMLKELHDNIHELDKLVAGDYVKRIEFDKNIDKLFKKLDEISKQLGKKADR